MGSRVFKNLVESHRDPIKEITIWDGASVDGKDTYLLALGAKEGRKKVLFLKEKFRHSEKRVVAVARDFKASDAAKLKRFDVVVFVPAGGDTLLLLRRILSKVKKVPFVVSNGVFGFGDEPVEVWKNPFENPRGPLRIYLERFKEDPQNTVWVGSGKLIREGLPATSTLMERIAERMSAEVFRLLLNGRG